MFLSLIETHIASQSWAIWTSSDFNLLCTAMNTPPLALPTLSRRQGAKNGGKIYALYTDSSRCDSVPMMTSGSKQSIMSKSWAFLFPMPPKFAFMMRSVFLGGGLWALDGDDVANGGRRDCGDCSSDCVEE